MKVQSKIQGGAEGSKCLGCDVVQQHDGRLLDHCDRVAGGSP